MDFFGPLGCPERFRCSALTGDEPTSRTDLARRLRDHGYAVILLDTVTEEELWALENWESTFRSAFDVLSTGGQPLESLECVSPSPYRAERGATLGFRRDENREFFETRRSFDGKIEPSSGVRMYNDIALGLFKLLTDVGRLAVRCLTEFIHLDSNHFIDLMDGPDINKDEHFSSSVLRICNYMPVEHSTATDRARDIAFGSHTDTSFVTVAPVSSNCGLEVMDLEDGSWHLAEVGAPRTSVVVFTGECLQMLTKSYYRAAVHRVRVTTLNNRVSCPLIMRGRKNAIIRQLDPEVLNSVPEDFREFIPDLSGTSMALVHKILDFKRLKCRNLNKENSSDWILAAYPCTVGKLSVSSGRKTSDTDEGGLTS